MTDHKDWTGKVGTIWAQEWRRTDRSFRELTPLLLAEIERQAFDNCLDIGCGAGEISLALAESNPQASLCGVDISSELLDVARQRSRELENLSFVHGDASQYSPAGLAPDLLVSRHGVMFFKTPVAAFEQLRMNSAPRARLVFSCFREREANDWVTQTLSVLPIAPQPPAPDEPGPFSFGDRSHVARIIDAAGWTEVDFAKIDFRMVFGEGEDALGDACDYLSRVGPTATPIAALESSERTKVLSKLRDVLAGFLEGGVVSLPAAAWIVTARAKD